jgi:tol-pal system protein YbgF
MPASRAISWGSVLSLSAALSGGCATARPPEATVRVADVEQTITDLRARNAGYARQIEELQNRIFILEDRLEMTRLADKQPALPLPPAKHIGPPAPASPVELPPPAPEIPTAFADDSTEAVEYAGEAALPQRASHPRPVLRLSGSGPVALASRPIGPPPSDVAPAPRVALASRRIGPSPFDIAPEARVALPSAAVPLYHRSLDALLDGRHAAALAGFRKFVALYPTHGYADNAQYWIGECFYDLNQFKSAAREFRRVAERWPHGNKVPDALLKLGYAELQAGNRREGRQALESLRRNFPHKEAAQLAARRLDEDNAAGPKVTVGMATP